jgi:hypothetical protein
MNDDDIPDYEYEYTIDEHTEKFEYASGYKSEYTPPAFDYDPEPEITEDDLIVFKAYHTIKDAHPTWTPEECMQTAYDWFLKKFNK